VKILKGAFIDVQPHYLRIPPSTSPLPRKKTYVYHDCERSLQLCAAQPTATVQADSALYTLRRSVHWVSLSRQVTITGSMDDVRASC